MSLIKDILSADMRCKHCRKLPCRCLSNWLIAGPFILYFLSALILHLCGLTP